MIVRYENIIDRKSFLKDVTKDNFEAIKDRSWCIIDNDVYRVNRIIEFTNHFNVLITPLEVFNMEVFKDKGSTVVPTDEELAIIAKLGQEAIDNVIQRKAEQLLQQPGLAITRPDIFRTVTD